MGFASHHTFGVIGVQGLRKCIAGRALPKYATLSCYSPSLLAPLVPVPPGAPAPPVVAPTLPADLLLSGALLEAVPAVLLAAPADAVPADAPAVAFSCRCAAPGCQQTRHAHLQRVLPQHMLAMLWLLHAQVYMCYGCAAG